MARRGTPSEALRRLPGLYSGWQGAAWTELQIEANGGAAAPRSALHRRLAGARGGSGGRISLLIGAGADPLLAAVASRGDPAFARLLSRLVDRWRRAAAKPRYADVVVGGAGALLACAEIHAWAPGAVPRPFVDGLVEIVARELDSEIEAAASGEVLLGFAHGVAGLLLALENAAAAFGARPPRRLRRAALALLEDERVRAPGRASLWPARSGGEILAGGWFDHGWCNGAPGIGLALAACLRLSGDSSYRAPALSALRATASFANGNDSLCCGAMGREQILLEAARLGLPAFRIAGRIRPPRGPGLFLGADGLAYFRRRMGGEPLPFPALGLLSAR